VSKNAVSNPYLFYSHAPKIVIISSYHPRLCLTNSFFTSRFPTKILYAFLFSPMFLQLKGKVKVKISLLQAVEAHRVARG
jgi:hypothetical protein